MTEASRKTTQVIDPKMVDALLTKRDALLAERVKLRKERDRMAIRDREIDRELADCQAAGRVFGIAVDLPPEDIETRSAATARWLAHENSVRRYYGGGESEAVAAVAAGARSAKAAAEAIEVIQKALSGEMPRISDIVLDRLKLVGSKGSKAAPIQAYIESTYRTKIHDKTVGMTLYRLAKEGLVRRDGHTWFVVPETTNPGVAAPGSSKSAT